jgi:hypothetical protein
VEALRAHRGSSEFNAIIKLLAFCLEDEKEKLVTCGPDGFQERQGAARGYRKLLDQLTRSDTVK